MKHHVLKFIALLFCHCCMVHAAKNEKFDTCNEELKHEQNKLGLDAWIENQVAQGSKENPELRALYTKIPKRS